MSVYRTTDRYPSEKRKRGAFRRTERQAGGLRLLRRGERILALSDEGFEVEWIADDQFRVDGVLDFYTTHRLFHDLRTDTSGAYTNPVDIAVRRLRQSDEWSE